VPHPSLSLVATKEMSASASSVCHEHRDLHVDVIERQEATALQPTQAQYCGHLFQQPSLRKVTDIYGGSRRVASQCCCGEVAPKQSGCLVRGAAITPRCLSLWANQHRNHFNCSFSSRLANPIFAVLILSDRKRNLRLLKPA
jgi:hypothetical protein